MATNNKYQPSSGSEGCAFTSKFCDQCIHEKMSHTGDDTDRSCDILTRTMCVDVNDKDYPSEWTYDDDGSPTCTKFYKHVWHDKHTGEIIDADYSQFEPVDPAQLDLFD